MSNTEYDVLIWANARPPVSTDARCVLAYCATHQHETAYRIVRDKRLPTVCISWNGIARTLGYEADCREAFQRARAAFDELRREGLIFEYDEGPGTFGHTTTCFVPQS